MYREHTMIMDNFGLKAFLDSRFRLDFTVGAQHYAGTFRILNQCADLVAPI